MSGRVPTGLYPGRVLLLPPPMSPEIEEPKEGDSAYVPEGVLEGIEDIAEGRTMSGEDLDDVLKF